MTGYRRRPKGAALVRGFAGLFLLAASGLAQLSNSYVSPQGGSSASGTIQTFTATYQDSYGYADIDEADLLFNTTSGSAFGCYVALVSGTDLYLANDAGNGFLGPLTPGSSGTLQNSQCTLYGTGSSGDNFGPSLILTARLSFTAAFAGGKYIFMQAWGGAGSTPPWQFMGNWTINAAGYPDLTVAKTHAGSFTQGQSGTYTISVTNSGSAATSGQVTVTDSLPTGLTASALSGSGWSCNPSTAICTRSDALGAGGSYPAITLSVNVANNAPASVTNNVGVSGGGETNTSNNNASDPTTIGSSGGGGGGATNVALGKAATQSSTLCCQTFTPGANLAVDGNSDGGFYNGSVTHTNSDPNAWWQVDLGTSSALSSITIWNRTDCCADRLSDYWVFVSDTPFLSTDTPATLQNRAGTWSNHQTVPPNPSTTIPTTAQGRYVRVQLTGTNNLSLAEVQVFGTGTPRPDLTVTKTHPGSFTQGQSGIYTITVTNSGSAATNATVTMTDSLPSGLTATGLSGSGWSCNVNTLTCSRGDALNAGSSYAPITLNVNVSNSATVGTVTNTATVSGGGETNFANDNGYDVTTINSSAGTPATMSSPTPGNVLSGSTVTFIWNASASATAYQLWVGTSSGGSQIILASAGLNTSQTVSGIPGNGIPIYVRLLTFFSNGSSASNDYQYVAPGGEDRT